METSSKGEKESPYCHRIFHKDPADYMRYVNREVSVEARDGTIHKGLLYTIDPVSESLVLVSLDVTGKLTNLQLIVGHAVVGLSVLDNSTADLESLFKACVGTDRLSREELLVCKESLYQWLVKNRLPVETEAFSPDLVCLSGALTITSPYQPENCQSTNEIILARVQKLIRNMPAKSEQEQ